MKNFFANIFIILATVIIALPANAVTKEEFEKARFIAAKAYVRYSNNGAGYLDEHPATSMAELEAQLAPHETDKKNLQNFKAKGAPSNYADWDKEKLMKYWSSEFFKGSGLSSEAASARQAKIKAGIGAMKIAPKEEQKPQEDVAVDTAKSTETDNQEAPELADELTTLTEEPTQDSIISDTASAITETETEESSSSSSTWIYVVILIILIAVVIVLVYYAARMMKQQPTDKPSQPSQPSQPVQPMQPVQPVQPVQPAQTVRTAPRAEEPTHRLQPAPAPQPHIHQSTQSATHPQAPAQNAQSIRTLYLGRANKDRIFVRSDHQFIDAKSIYILQTANGYTGTFRVIDDPRAIATISTNPAVWLANGCEIATMATAGDIQSIVTDEEGIAIFSDGCWRVSRPAAIHFE